MEFQEIRYEVADRIATLTLHRPERLNAFTARMCKEMIGAFDLADADGNQKVTPSRYFLFKYQVSFLSFRSCP